MMQPRIVLHIGRNKCGSTTIQDFCLAARQDLLDCGVSYTMFGHLKDSQPGVPGFETFDELAIHAHANCDHLHLVSYEFMFNWPKEFAWTAARALADCDVRIIAYLRPYDAWLLSVYSEETRNGRNTFAIDDFERHFPYKLSALPYLSNWAEAFGWERLSIRALDPSWLQGGDLLADFTHVLGISPIAGAVPRSNVSPHWIELELARCLARCNSEIDWQGVTHAEFAPLLGAMSTVAKRAPDIPYLTLARRRELVDLYNADLDRIEADGGGLLPRAPPPSGGDRWFQPSLRQAPCGVVLDFLQIAASARFQAQYPAAAARAVRLAYELGLPDVFTFTGDPVF